MLVFLQVLHHSVCCLLPVIINRETIIDLGNLDLFNGSPVVRVKQLGNIRVFKGEGFKLLLSYGPITLSVEHLKHKFSRHQLFIYFCSHFVVALTWDIDALLCLLLLRLLLFLRHRGIITDQQVFDLGSIVFIGETDQWLWLLIDDVHVTPLLEKPFGDFKPILTDCVKKRCLIQLVYVIMEWSMRLKELTRV